MLTQKETGDAIKATDDNPTQSIEEKVKETEQLFDKAVQEIHDIHLHTPKLQRPESYEDYDFETLAAQATHNYMEEKGADIEIEWEEKRRDSDRNWNQKREAIEQQYQETLDEQASIQASLTTQETDRVRQEYQKIKQEIAATSDDIRNQNESQTRALGRLKTMVAEIKTMKQELRDDTNELTQLKISTREETAQIKETMKEARRIQQALQEDIEDARHTQKTLQDNVEHTVKSTIQTVVDSQMVKVERAIKDTLQKRGKLLVHQAKLDMAEQFGNQEKTLTENMERTTEETYQEAASLLDQAVMKIGEEMSNAVQEFQDHLSDPHTRTRLVESLQKRAMHAIVPQIEALQDKVTEAVTEEIADTVRLAQDDLHLSQATLTADTEQKIRRYNESARSNNEALMTDLRQEAENLEAALEAKYQEHLNRPPTEPEQRTQQPNTPERDSSRNPYRRPPPVSPHHEVNIPNEDTWNQMVSKCKEKVSITYSLPPDVTDLDQTTAEAFYRQIESNFKGYPVVRLRPFDLLTRRGNTIPREYAMGWPPEYISEGSTILYEKLTDAIPHKMSTMRHILDTHQNGRDGYRALMAIMKRSIPMLGQLPPKMEPSWPPGVTPTAYVNKLQAYTKQQARSGRFFCDFEIASTLAERAMEHHEFYNVASQRVAVLINMAANYDDFQDITLPENDVPTQFATTLESYQQRSRENHIKSMEAGVIDPTIRKFERNTSNQARNGNRGAPRDNTRDRDGKPRELCPCCLRHGHNVEKGSVCWMGAQVENVLVYNKEHPLVAAENMKNFKTALNPATIKRIIAQFPEQFQDMEPDSLEIIEAAVDLFSVFHQN
jgi:hypothetical protein